MLDLTARQRTLRLREILRRIVEVEVNDSGENGMILLDNTEVLFDPGLKQDPLRLLRGLSRDKTVAAAWSGTPSRSWRAGRSTSE